MRPTLSALGWLACAGLATTACPGPLEGRLGMSSSGCVDRECERVAELPSDCAGCAGTAACDHNGVCQPSSDGGLVIDLRTVELGGELLVRGGAPPNGCSGSALWRQTSVRLYEVRSGRQMKGEARCEPGEPGWRWRATTFPGLYDIGVFTLADWQLPTQPLAWPRNATAMVRSDPAVTLDLDPVLVSGTFAIENFSDAEICPHDGDVLVVLTFEEQRHGDKYAALVECHGSQRVLPFSLDLYPGSYRVRAYRGQFAAIPEFKPVPLFNTLEVDAKLEALELSLGPVEIELEVTVGGQPLGDRCPKYAPYAALIEWLDAPESHDSTLLRCQDGHARAKVWLEPGAHPIRPSLPAGSTYGEVGSSYWRGATWEERALIVTGPGPLTVDLPGAWVEGQVLDPLGAFAEACGAGPEDMRLLLYGADEQPRANLGVGCSAFAGWIPAGEHWLEAYDNHWGESQSGVLFAGTGPLTVAAGDSGAPRTVEVEQRPPMRLSGTLAFEGSGRPQSCAEWHSGGGREVILERQGPVKYTASVVPECTPPGATLKWELEVPTGEYRARIAPLGPVAGPAYLHDQAIFVDEDGVPPLDLLLRLVRLSGRVTLDGRVPSGSCQGGEPLAKLFFEEVAGGYAFEVPLDCPQALPDFRFEADLFPGTYRVSVLGAETTDLPSETPFVALWKLAVE